MLIFKEIQQGENCMSYTIPFLSSPFGYAFQAYKNVSFELPLMKRNLFFSQQQGLSFSQGRRVYKGDSDYNTVLRSLPGYHVKEEIQPFLDKEQIRKA